MAEKLRGASQILNLGGCFRPDVPEPELADRSGQHPTWCWAALAINASRLAMAL